jgi:hypothetical protein
VRATAPPRSPLAKTPSRSRVVVRRSVCMH